MSGDGRDLLQSRVRIGGERADRFRYLPLQSSTLQHTTLSLAVSVELVMSLVAPGDAGDSLNGVMFFALTHTSHG